MTGQQIREIFKANDNKQSIMPSMSTIANINIHTPVKLGMDEKTLDYYYEVDILEMAKSDIDDKLISQMKEDGWKVSKDRKSLVNYC